MTIPTIEDRLGQVENQQRLLEQYLTSAFWMSLDRAYEINLRDRMIRCLVCERTGRRDEWDIVVDTCMFGGGRLERYRCPDCDCIFGPLKFLDLSDEFVALDYRLLYSSYSESDSTESEIRTFRSLSPKPDGVYLDWGCGGSWSATVDSLRADGYNVWGFEPSAQTSSEFVVNHRGHVSARFDGIFSNNVIEHFRDPIAEFRDLHGLLKEGGRMAHSSPCFDYRYSFTRFHTLFLLGRSAEVLAERTGFRLIERQEDGDYINVVFDRVDG